MRTKMIRFLPFGLILALLFSIVPAGTVSALGVPVAVIPTSNNVQAGSNFPIDITVDSVSDLDAYSFDLGFDQTVIQPGSVTAGQIGVTSLLVSSNSGAPGTITITHASNGTNTAGTGVSGTGKLATVNFQVLPGTYGLSSTLTLSNVVMKTPTGSTIDNSPAGGSVSVQYPPVNVTISAPTNVPSGDTFTVHINTSLVHNFAA